MWDQCVDAFASPSGCVNQVACNHYDPAIAYDHNPLGAAWFDVRYSRDLTPEEVLDGLEAK